MPTSALRDAHSSAARAAPTRRLNGRAGARSNRAHAPLRAAHPPLDHAAQPDRRCRRCASTRPGRPRERLAPRPPRRRAVGGAGLVVVEATAVEAARAASRPRDLGLWDDAQVEPLARGSSAFVEAQGAVAGVQLAHAGRKASHAAAVGRRRPGRARGRAAGRRSGRAPLPFADGYPARRALDEAGIGGVVERLRGGGPPRARGGLPASLEVHAAHGYLLHQFLSPLSNRRDRRVRRLVREPHAARRARWSPPCGRPGRSELPLLVRISATDWVEGGWDVDESVELARALATLGVDLVDVSSGGLVATAKVPAGPGYQAAFAERIRREAGVATGAVG